MVSDERIERSILLIRGRKVLLDADLAELYGVTTKRLNEQVKRNIDRFPKDFMFQLDEQEIEAMRSQIATASDSDKDIRSQIATASKRNIRYLPYAFTEHGVIMAASILNTQRAIEVSVYVVRVFVRLREMFSANKELAHKLAELEHKVGKHDETIRSLVVAIQQLMAPPVKGKKQIGFRVGKE
jgi:ribosomal protein S13